MLDDEKLVELLVRRDDLLEQGCEATPEAVCEECPELLGEYRARLESLKRTDWLFETDHGEDEGSLSLPVSATASIIGPQLPVSSLTTDQFLRAITDSGLMTTDEIEEFQQSISREVSSDTQFLARELVHQNRLTLYQASVLLAERSDPLLLDRYVILDAIDSGGMGIVFKALHRSMDRVVALKTLPPSALDSEEKIKRFKREAKTAAMLSHPNIVITHDAHESNGIHFLVMEYVKGNNLGKVVRSQGPLPVATAVDYVLQAARGLEHVHSQGIIHRDIKPGNLLLDPDGTVKVSDVGLARLETPDGAALMTEEELTIAGGVMGTATFMSPEQAANTHNADACSDVYSLGCTMYYLLTGKPPYQEDTLINTILAHRDKPIPPLSETRDDIPEDVIAVYRRMMAKKSEDRYQSMTEVIEALTDCVVGRTGGITSSPPLPRNEAQESAETIVNRSRATAWWWGSAMGTIAIFILVLFLLSKGSHVVQEDEANPIAKGQDPPPLAIAPFTAEQAKQHQQVWADYLGVPVEFENSIGMKMVLVPPGEFMMGSTEEEIQPWLKRGGNMSSNLEVPAEQFLAHELPQHKVRITKPFTLAAHEVSVGQFKEFVDATRYETEAEPAGEERNWTNPGFSFKQTDMHPVVCVSWNDASAFCKWLGDKECKVYRLPTEAEWEYACRAGSTTNWCYGDDDGKLKQYAWYYSTEIGIIDRSMATIGEKLPNQFGLFDMHGSVHEWCSDWFSPSYYKLSMVNDPNGPSNGTVRVRRGGAIHFFAWVVRSATRGWNPPTNRYPDIGFRPVSTCP